MQAELKSIIFALCFFHGVVCERRKFGPIGWNRSYPFNQGDLSVCITVANNYLDASSKVNPCHTDVTRPRSTHTHTCTPTDCTTDLGELRGRT